ncbi:MAG: metal-dependent hydrolase [bacterium]|nr:metal-dependent hydrolase [bacterium]
MVNLEFLGHSCFKVSDDNYSVIIDPFLTGNPQAAAKAEDIKVNAVLLTHGHGDHAGDGITIAKNNDATVVAPFELATYCERQGCKVHPMHIGGGYQFDFGHVKLTQALHGSAVMDGDIPFYTGNPCGIILTMSGKTIYHAGDTGLFGDMKLIGELHDIDCALLPIGDNFTMGIKDALYGLKLIDPKFVIPMHYNTFPVIEVDPEEFASGAKDLGYECRVMKSGGSTQV